VLREVHHIADAAIRQVDSVDDLCQLLGQPNLHTRSISTNVRRTCVVGPPYSFAVGMKGLCPLFRVRGLKTAYTTPFGPTAATVVPLSQLHAMALPMSFVRRRPVVVGPHSLACPAPNLAARPSGVSRFAVLDPLA
jgi:hypothetical protein